MIIARGSDILACVHVQVTMGSSISEFSDLINIATVKDLS